MGEGGGAGRGRGEGRGEEGRGGKGRGRRGEGGKVAGAGGKGAFVMFFSVKWGWGRQFEKGLFIIFCLLHKEVQNKNGIQR